MSSKFSMPTSSPKPPPICIKPPGLPQWGPPDWPNEIYQGYVEYTTPFSPLEGSLTGSLILDPEPQPGWWMGSLTIDQYDIVITMHWAQFEGLIDWTLEFYQSGNLLDTWEVENSRPRNRAPFDSDQVTVPPIDQGMSITWHFWQ